MERLAARSTAAAERTSRSPPAPARRSLLPWMITTGAVAFSIGMIANPWFEASVRSNLPSQLQGGATSASASQLDGLEIRVKALEASNASGMKEVVASSDAATSGLATRIASLEAAVEKLTVADANVGSRLDKLSAELAATAGASIGGQVVVRELLLLSAARRLVESGKPLGVLEAPVVQSLGPRDKSAADALVAWSAAPTSRQGLLLRLEEPVAETAARPEVGSSWWDRLLARLSGVIQVREVDGLGNYSGVSEPAAAALRAGELERAIAAVELAETSQVRELWLADARRQLAAEDALDRLETLLLSVSATAGGLVAQTLSQAAGQPAAIVASPEGAAS